MNDLKVMNQRYEAVAWGVILVWLSILMIIPGDQNNWFIFGIGIVLLGLNLVRSVNQITVNWFTVTLGALSLAAGGLSLLWPVFGLKTHIEVGFFPLIVLVFGLYLLIPGPKKEIASPKNSAQ